MSDERLSLPHNAKVVDDSDPRKGGTYVIIEVLGVGGLAITYRAWSERDSQEVALKEFFPQDYAARDPYNQAIYPVDQESADTFNFLRSVFADEAYRAARLDHPNIVEILHRPFQANRTGYFAMRLIKGQTLSSRLENGQHLTWGECWPILEGVLDALEAVHSEGMQHLDISAKNVMIEEGKGPVLIDFGNARLVLPPSASKRDRSLRMETPGYAAPEQSSDSAERGPWTDIYSVGALMYRVLSGKQPPHGGFSDPSIIQRDIQAKQRAVPVDVILAIRQCVLSDHSKRPQTIAALREMLLPAITRPNLAHGPSFGRRGRHAVWAAMFGLASLLLIGLITLAAFSLAREIG